MKKAIALVLVALSVASCTQTEKGAGIGAVSGAIIGGAITGDVRGAAVGAAIGGHEGVLAAVDPRNAVAAKKSAGGTAPERVDEQIAWVRAGAEELANKAASVPSLDDLRRAVAAEAI